MAKTIENQRLTQAEESNQCGSLMLKFGVVNKGLTDKEKWCLEVRPQRGKVARKINLYNEDFSTY